VAKVVHKVTAQEDDARGIESNSLSDNVSFLRPDAELEMLVSVANDVGISWGITLVTTGGVVTGNPIPYSMFWNSTANEIEAIPATDPASAAANGALAKSYRERAAAAEAERAKPDEDKDKDRWPPRYIHLKDTRIHDGGRSVELGLWRGELARVVGWSFGAPS